MKKYLSICVQIEEVAGKIYQQLAEKPDVPLALKKIFLELSRDEEDHAMQLRFATRFTEGTALIEKTYDIGEAQALLARARALLAKAAEPGLTIDQCLEFAIELERDFCKIHLENTSEFVDENIRKMFKALTRADNDHIEKLTEACTHFASQK